MAGCVLQTKSWRPWPLTPLEPACALLKACLFSLVPQTPTPVQVGPGRSGVGVEGSWVSLWEKRRKRQRTDSLARLPRQEPRRMPGRAGACRKQSPGWQQEGGQWNQNSKGQEKEGPQGRREGGFSESYKLKTERMSCHLHSLPLLMGIISLAPSFPEG